MTLTKPAIMVQQGQLTILSVCLTVKELQIPGFYTVDKLDAADPNSGYQRVLDKTRIKRLADYIIEAWEDGSAFLPTSVLLATSKDIAFDSTSSSISFNIRDVGPFSVVDGQHRIEGLLEAARKKPEIEGFSITANIAINLTSIEQMCHFLIVNTTQKSVDKAVQQQIVARLSGMVDIEDIPTLPRWIQRQVMKGEDREALVITYYLNSAVDSPWFRKILMANEERNDEHAATQKTFVNSLKKYILVPSNPLSGINDIDKRNRILKNYWLSVGSLFVDPDIPKESVVFKTNGVDFFHMVSATVFAHLNAINDFRVETITELFENAFEHLPNEYLSMKDPTWWLSGGGVSGLNTGGVTKYASEFSRSIHSTGMNEDLKL